MADTHRVDRTDRHLQFQSPYEGGRVNIQFEGAGGGYGQSGYGGGGGYGQSGYGGGGYKSMMPESGPSSTQVTFYARFAFLIYIYIYIYIFFSLIFMHTKLMRLFLEPNKTCFIIPELFSLSKRIMRFEFVTGAYHIMVNKICIIIFSQKKIRIIPIANNFFLFKDAPTMVRSI